MQSRQFPSYSLVISIAEVINVSSLMCARLCPGAESCKLGGPLQVAQVDVDLWKRPLAVEGCLDPGGRGHLLKDPELESHTQICAGTYMAMVWPRGGKEPLS